MSKNRYILVIADNSPEMNIALSIFLMLGYSLLSNSSAAFSGSVTVRPLAKLNVSLEKSLRALNFTLRGSGLGTGFLNGCGPSASCRESKSELSKALPVVAFVV